MTSSAAPSMLPPSESSNNTITSSGKLSATILSVYDIPPTTLPTGDDASTTSFSSTSTSTCPVPSYVSMSVMGREVKTGKPSSKHKVMNNFKFVSTDKSSPSTNALSLTAPLSVLYPTTVTFRVVFPSSETLVAKCKLSKTLQVNQQQWLILNLYPESTFTSTGTGTSPSSGKEDDTNSVYSTSTTGLPTATGSVSGDHTPTLRLKLCLTGPYRTEVGAILTLAQSWFSVIDSISDATSSTVTSITQSLPLKFPPAKILLVPTVPLAAASVALLPIALGILVLGLPFFVPILVVLLTVGISTILVGSGVYFSTAKGRESASIVLGPIYSTFVSTQSGQQLLYQTGPRPSPPALVRTIMPTDIIGKLVISLLIDFIGSSSYLLPFVGEGFDLAWAPIQTVFIMALYDEKMPGMKYVSFFEEILPFTDLIPTGTLGWVREFSPLLFEEGMKKVEDLRVVMRSEGDALRKGI